ncbi:MAG: SLBB domain-containing protein [Deltaproteobacteria bacterium]|nr:SLBB domain-containing protein [Deltaproteobacteria bacterium]
MGRLITIALALVTVAGCHRYDDPPIYPHQDPAFTQTQPPEPAGIDDDPAEAMKVLPGDVILLRTFSAENTEYGGLVVDEQGTLHVPLGGDVQVGGLTLTEAEERVQTALRRLDTVVRVGLAIIEPRGHMGSVVGAVGEPGRYIVYPGMRLADLLAAAGGPRTTVESVGDAGPIADIAGARLVRNGQTLDVSVRRALEGDPRHNVRVRAGDHLYVPMARENLVIVLGAVDSAGVFAHRQGLRLTEVLARSGGLNERGDRTHINIVRGSLEAPQVYTASLRAISRGSSPDVYLAAGDIIYVTEEWTAHVGEVLTRLGPLLADPATVALAVAVTR